jgi:hypothetical protein
MSRRRRCIDTTIGIRFPRQQNHDSRRRPPLHKRHHASATDALA